MIAAYVKLVKAGLKTIEEVPERIRDAVKKALEEDSEE